MIPKETYIQQLRFIVQRLMLDGLEDSATKELKVLYGDLIKTARKAYENQINLVKGSSPEFRLKYLEEQFNIIVDSVTKKLSSKALEFIAIAGSYSYESTNDLVSWDGKVENFTNVYKSPEQVKAIVLGETLGGKTFESWMNLDTQNLKAETKTAIKVGLANGVGYDKLVRSMIKDHSAQFKLEKIEDNIIALETVVKTYIQSVNISAHKEIYSKNSDLIKKVEWSAVLENGNVKTGKGTCPRCAALDGQEYKNHEDAPPCPLHPRCRCMLVPITKTWDELFKDERLSEKNLNELRETEWKTENLLGKKWNVRDLDTRRIQESDWKGLATRLKNGNDYSDWWETRNKSFRDNAVGPVRSALITETDLNFEDIVNRDTGELYTLQELVKTNKVSQEQLTKARHKALL